MSATYFIAHSFGDQDIRSDGPFLAMPFDVFTKRVKDAMVNGKPGFMGITRHLDGRITTVAHFGIPQACRICHCTENEACYDELTDAGCHWVEDNLCSVCAREAATGGAIIENQSPPMAPGDAQTQAGVPLQAAARKPWPIDDRAPVGAAAVDPDRRDEMSAVVAGV